MSERPTDYDGRRLRAQLTPDGRVLLTWAASRLSRPDRLTAHALVAAPGASVSATVLGGPLRDADGVAPVLLDGGALAASWIDNGAGGGRVHLAVDGVAPSPQPPFPAVRIGRPDKTVVASATPLIVPVTCSAACDLRARLSTGGTATASLTHAGTVRLRLGGEGRPAAPRHGGRVTVRVASGPPGATSARTKTLRVRLRRPAPPPRPRVLTLTAVRDGGAVLVSWTTDRPATGYTFEATASSTSRFRVSTGAEIRGAARTSYRVRLIGRDKLRHVRLRLRYGGATVGVRRAQVRN